MAVEFSRRPLLSLLFSLWLSIFNLNSSCNWLEGQQGGTLLVGCAMPHGSQCAGSPLPLKKHFCCNAEISPRIRQFIFLHFSFLFWTWQYKSKGIWKRPLGRLYPWLCCITQWFCYSTSAILFIGYIAFWKKAQAVCPNTTTLRMTFDHHCNIYIRGSLIHGGWTLYYSAVKVNFWFWFYKEWFSLSLRRNTGYNITFFFSLEETCLLTGHKWMKIFFVPHMQSICDFTHTQCSEKWQTATNSKEFPHTSYLV